MPREAQYTAALRRRGDLPGDWREEGVYTNGDFNELIDFTTDGHQAYTLAHNPAYRNDMTVRGYMQLHHVDYFLGGMPPAHGRTSATPPLAPAHR